VSLTILTDGSDLNNLDNVTLLGVKPIRQIKDVAAFVSELVINCILFPLYEYYKVLFKFILGGTKGPAAVHITFP